MTFDPTTYPFDTVVYITDTIGGQGWQGSGVLISPDEVLTASHVVYNSVGGLASNISVTPAYNLGSRPFGSASGTFVHYFQVQDAGDSISNQQSQFDYAVIHLSTSFPNLGTMGFLSNFAGGMVNVTGYPGSLNGQMENSQQFVTQDPYYTLLDGTTIGKGSSGGPVWITGSNNGPYVVGVVSSEQGGAGSTGFFTQITTTAFNQIAAWLAQDDGKPTTTTVVSSITASPNTGDVTTGGLVTVTLTMSAAVTVSGGVPTLSLNDGGSARYDAARSSSTALVFDYTVLAGQSTGGLAVTGLSTNGATILDANRKSADFSGAQATFGSLAINAAPVVIRDVFSRASNGQLVVSQDAADGTLIRSIPLTVGGNPVIIDSATNIIGNSVNFLRSGGMTAFLRSSAGQLFAWEFSSGGTMTAGAGLTIGSSPVNVDAATTIIGVGTSLLGAGGSDAFLRSATGQLVAWEFNSSGRLVSGAGLTFGGSPVTVDAGTTVTGTGTNFCGNGGNDVFLRSATGHLVAWEFNSAGQWNGGLALTFAGSPVVVDTATAVIGTGTNFQGAGGSDVFLRTATGQLMAWEFNGAGQFVSGAGLTFGGSPVIVDSATTVIGTGTNFSGSGGNDVFLRGSTGQLVAWEFNSAGQWTAGASLTNAGNAFTVDASVIAAGTGSNFWGTGGHDVFLRYSDGSIAADEFKGAQLSAAAFLNAGGSHAHIDAATTVVGTAANTWGQGGSDVFLRAGNGNLADWEFLNGQISANGLLTYAGSLVRMGVGTTITDTGAANMLGAGGHDVSVRVASGLPSTWEISNGVVLKIG